MWCFSENTARILISSCPFALPNWKLHRIVETSGAVIVSEESCVGKRYYYQIVDEKFSSIEEGLKKIAGGYLATHCACFTPNDERIEDIKKCISRKRQIELFITPCNFAHLICLNLIKLKEK